MAQLNNPMEIFKLLERSNCRQCNETTCLAFASAVFRGQKCPRLDSNVIETFGGKSERQSAIDPGLDESAEQLKKEIASIDISSAAERVRGRFSDGRLTIKILGKDFSIDSGGNCFSDIHMHPWLMVPVLNYITDCSGKSVSGNWVPLRELENGKSWYRLFGQRCEKPLKKVADTYTDVFEDMIHIFNGKQVENHYASDISLVLYPLPRVPILICYWKPEEGLESSLNIFFDSTAEDNLQIESIYALGAGLVRMFEKIALRHGLQ
ncbi:MAG: DUF3786 domain-containing protein [Desulfobacteraceae bacterium]|nr:DUF3786 domain-containing protein [Desulfobacteraceae bacterium]